MNYVSSSAGNSLQRYQLAPIIKAVIRLHYIDLLAFMLCLGVRQGNVSLFLMQLYMGSQ